MGKLRNAVDFIAPQNTPVLAAADGKVTYVKDDSNVGGSDPSYWNYSKFISITHKNGENNRYDHLDTQCKGKGWSTGSGGPGDCQGWNDSLYVCPAPSLSGVCVYGV